MYVFDDAESNAMVIVPIGSQRHGVFAANKYNYSRYCLYYVRSMTCLGPEIMDRFCQGQQSLHHTAGIYNGQWRVIFIETNWMRKGHGTGGIIGMTENPQSMAS